MTWAPESHPLKSPTTLISTALGAHTAKCTPAAPSEVSQVRAELVVNAGMGAFAEQMEVVVREERAGLL